MGNNKPRGGSSCAVATCTNYSGKTNEMNVKHTKQVNPLISLFMNYGR